MGKGPKLIFCVAFELKLFSRVVETLLRRGATGHVVTQKQTQALPSNISLRVEISDLASTYFRRPHRKKKRRIKAYTQKEGTHRGGLWTICLFSKVCRHLKKSFLRRTECCVCGDIGKKNGFRHSLTKSAFHTSRASKQRWKNVFL